jgi:hypothetical protein
MFRAYCIIVLGGNIGDIKSEIEKFSETKIQFIQTDTVFIGTFVSLADTYELKEFFRETDRNFFIFDLDDNVSAFGLSKPEIEEGLFGFLKNLNLDDMNENFMSVNHISGQTIQSNASILSDIEEMSPSDKESLMNKILDKGLNNITEYDKKILNLLAK